MGEGQRDGVGGSDADPLLSQQLGPGAQPQDPGMMTRAEGRRVTRGDPQAPLKHFKNL